MHVARSRHIIQSCPKPNSDHSTRIWDLGQVPNRGAVPIVRLLEMSLRQTSGIWQVAKVLTPRSMAREEEDQLCLLPTHDSAA
jgi:hypothetical protein